MYIIEKNLKTHTAYGHVSDNESVVSNVLVGCGTKEQCSEYLQKTAISSPYKWVAYGREGDLYTSITLVDSWPKARRSIEYRARFCPEF